MGYGLRRIVAMLAGGGLGRLDAEEVVEESDVPSDEPVQRDRSASRERGGMVDEAVCLNLVSEVS
jgi:hypothetical protein